MLTEYGIVIAQGLSQLRKKLPLILEEQDTALSEEGKKLFRDLKTQLYARDEEIAAYDQRIKRICKRFAICEHLTQIPGLGPLTVTAMVARVSDATIFKNGREMSAFLGLVPKQHSSGGKQRLLGISKRGDRYLRCLGVHGARSVVTRAKTYRPNGHNG